MTRVLLIAALTVALPACSHKPLTSRCFDRVGNPTCSFTPLDVLHSRGGEGV